MQQICPGANAPNPAVGPVCSARSFRKMLPQNAHPLYFAKCSLIHCHINPIQKVSSDYEIREASESHSLMQLFKQHAQHTSNKLTVFSGHPTPKLHVTVSKIGFIQSTFEDIFLAFLHTALWSKMWRMLLSFCQNFKTQAKKRKRAGLWFSAKYHRVTLDLWTF